MAACGNCGAASVFCTCSAATMCYTIPTDYCVEAEGNGSISFPFQFHSDQYPTPRPFGFIQRTTQLDNIPSGSFQTVVFNSDPSGIEGGMSNIAATPDRLIAPVDGIYLFGAFGDFSGDPGDECNFGITKNNSFTGGSVVRLRITTDTTTRPVSIMTLTNLVVGDFLQLQVSGAGSATMDLIVLDAGLTTRPTLWALWVGNL